MLKMVHEHKACEFRHVIGDNYDRHFAVKLRYFNDNGNTFIVIAVICTNGGNSNYIKSFHHLYSFLGHNLLFYESPLLDVNLI